MPPRAKAKLPGMAAVTTFAEYGARLLSRQRSETRAMIEMAIDRASQDPRPGGSGIEKLLRWLAEHPNGGFYKLLVFDEGIDHSIRLLNAIDQHARTVELMLHNNAIEGATLMTVYRAALEATAQLCYLHDPAVPVQDLAARNVAARLAFFHGNETTSLAFGAQIPAAKTEDATSAVDGVQAFLRSNGVELDEGRPPRHFARWVRVDDSRRANVRFNATEAIAAYVGGTWKYAIGSGATHALGWLLPSFVAGIEEKLAEDGDIVVSVVEGLLDCADAIARAAEGHSGLDTTPVRKKTLRRRVAMVAQVRGGAPSGIDLATYEERGPMWAPAVVPATYGSAFGLDVSGRQRNVP